MKHSSLLSQVNLPCVFLFILLQDQVIEDRPFGLPQESSAGKLALAFSGDARYLAVFDQQRPRVLWVWELPYFLLKSVLVHSAPVKCKYIYVVVFNFHFRSSIKF